jgi:hypothetical protein
LKTCYRDTLGVQGEIKNAGSDAIVYCFFEKSINFAKKDGSRFSVSRELESELSRVESEEEFYCM